MDIPIELFLGFIGTSIALAIFGFIRQPAIPALLCASGMFILTIVIATNNIIVAYSALDTVEFEQIPYNVETNTVTPFVNAIQRSIVAEYPSASNSELIGDTIDCIDIPLAKTGSPPSNTPIIVGIFDSGGNIVKQFGDNLNTTALTSAPAFFKFSFCLDNGDSYTIGSIPAFSERIGVMYNSGNSTNTVVTRSDGNNPFDGTITYRQSFLSGSWSSTTAEDLTMTLTNGMNEQTLSVEPILYEFTELPKTLFALLGVFFMLSGGLMVMRD